VSGLWTRRLRESAVQRPWVAKHKVLLDATGEDLHPIGVKRVSPGHCHGADVRRKLHAHHGVMPVTVIPASRLRAEVVNVPVVHGLDAKPLESAHLGFKRGPVAGVVGRHEAILPELTLLRHKRTLLPLVARSCRWRTGRDAPTGGDYRGIVAKASSRAYRLWAWFS